MKELFREVDKINRLIFEAQAAVNAAPVDAGDAKTAKKSKKTA